MGRENLEKRLAAVEEQRGEILEAMKEQRRRQKITCSCGTMHAIGSLSAIQAYDYIPPVGEIGGDFWVEGELRYICPTTGVVNRLLFDNNDVPYEERQDFKNDPEAQFKEKYRGAFKEVEKIKREGPMDGKWANNFYPDQHRKKFGLVAKRKT